MAVIFGTGGRDHLTGTVGADFIFGDAGRDTIGGSAGDDTIVGGLDRDEIWGGPGRDEFRGSITTWTNDVLADFSSEDRIVLTSALVDAADILVSPVQGDGRVYVQIDADRDGFIQIEADAYFSVADQGMPIRFEVAHIDGDSYLTVVPAGGALIDGDEGPNLIEGGPGNDTLRGFDGNDTLDGGPGMNRLEGGAGDDVYRYRYGLTEVVETADGGRDRIEFTGTVITLPDEVEDLTVLQPLGGTASYGYLDGNALGNVITMAATIGTNFSVDAGAGDDRVETAAGNDSIFGGQGDDGLSGGDGNDTIHGMNGADTLSGGAGDDWLFGGEDDREVYPPAQVGADLRDEIYGGAGDDYIVGLTGDDLLEGGEGRDTLAGGAGSDRMSGGDGDDYLNGGWGYDRLTGGAGADFFFHRGTAGHGTDWITDYSAGEGDVLVWGGLNGDPGYLPAAAGFAVHFARTAGAGSDDVDEAFIVWRPTGQILWALVDGAAEISLLLKSGFETFDLLA